MNTIFVADKSLKELGSLFLCEIDDSDFYDVIGFNIAQNSPHFLFENIHGYQGMRLRGAIFGLGATLKASEELNSLLKGYLKHDDPMIISQAIDALRCSEAKDLWAEIHQLAKHGSPYVRGAVLRFSRYALSAKESFSTLVNALNDPDFIVRENAVDELGELGDRDAVHSLRPLRKDPHPEVREAADAAIRGLENLR